MQIKTREEEIKQDFTLPSSIQEKVNTKGFHLYEWISPKDVKKSIERDFLKILNYIWIPLAVISVIAGGVFYQNFFLMFSVFFWIIVSVSFLILLYLFFVAIKRSILLTKNAYIIITDSSLSLNWRIVKQSDMQDIKWDIEHISKVFDEELFGESNLDINKWGLLQSIKKKLLDWYSWIFSTFWRGRWKGIAQALIVILILYTVYVIAMAFVYFVGAFTVWIFSSILTIINRFVLLQTWNEVLTINALFEKIDKDSFVIENEKNTLLDNLKDAKNNEWMDALLTKINDGIITINKATNNAIETNVKLKSKLKQSRYSEMFNFKIYNSWIRKQILDPLTEIYEILDANYKLLFDTIGWIDKQITETKNVSLQAPLIAQKKRLEMKREEIEKHINMIAKYLYKLKDEK